MPPFLLFTKQLHKRTMLRKYLFGCILIFLVIIIFIQILQESQICREKEIGDQYKLQIHPEEVLYSQYGSGYVRKGAINLQIPSYMVGQIQDGELTDSFFVTATVKQKQSVLTSISSGSENSFTQTKMSSELAEMTDSKKGFSLIGNRFCQIRLTAEEIIPVDAQSTSGFSAKNAFFLWREKIRRFFQTPLQKTLLGTHAAFMNGVIFGGQDGLPQNRVEEFTIVGLTHIIVASGYNVMIVSVSILHLSQFFLNYRGRRLFSLVFIWGYSFLTGFTAPIVRASLMMTFILIGQLIGRKTRTGWTLLLASLIVLFVNPWWLFSLSFQLSFLATAALVWMVPILKTVLPNIVVQIKQPFIKTIGQEIQENFLSTLAALIFTTPLISYHFERLSIVSIVANTVLLSFIPILMALGFLLIVSWVLHPLVATVISLPISAILTIFFFTVHIFSTPWWANVTVHISLAMMLGCYGIVGICMWYYYQNHTTSDVYEN